MLHITYSGPMVLSSGIKKHDIPKTFNVGLERNNVFHGVVGDNRIKNLISSHSDNLHLR